MYLDQDRRILTSYSYNLEENKIEEVESWKSGDDLTYSNINCLEKKEDGVMIGFGIDGELLRIKFE